MLTQSDPRGHGPCKLQSLQVAGRVVLPHQQPWVPRTHLPRLAACSSQLLLFRGQRTGLLGCPKPTHFWNFPYTRPLHETHKVKMCFPGTERSLSQLRMPRLVTQFLQGGIFVSSWNKLTCICLPLGRRPAQQGGGGGQARFLWPAQCRPVQEAHTPGLGSEAGAGAGRRLLPRLAPSAWSSGGPGLCWKPPVSWGRAQ